MPDPKYKWNTTASYAVTWEGVAMELEQRDDNWWRLTMDDVDGCKCHFFDAANAAQAQAIAERHYADWIEKRSRPCD